MANPTPSEAAQRQLDAYNARDLPAFLAVYAPDCVVRAFPSGQVLMADRATMESRYATLFRDHPDLHCRLLSRVEHAPFVIDHERVDGLSEEGPVHAVALYEVRGALIRNVWFLRADEPLSPGRS